MSGNLMSAGLGPGGSAGIPGLGNKGPGGMNMNFENAIDKENKNFAMRIKKCPLYKYYKQAKQSFVELKQ